MVNYNNDSDFEEDNELGCIGLKWIQDQQLYHILFFVSVSWTLHKINLNTSLKLYLISECTQLWQKKQTDRHKEK